MPIWAGNTNYVIFFSILSTLPFTIIIITTIWTYIFTRRFLKKDFEHRKTVSQNELEQFKHEKSIYNVRIRNLIGVFGMLLLFNVITFSPYIIASLIGLIVGLDNIPSEIYATVLILFLLNNITNSVIQSYFRQDLRECIVSFSMMLFHRLSRTCCNCCSCNCSQEEKVDDRESKVVVPVINLPDGPISTNHMHNTIQKPTQTGSDEIKSNTLSIAVDLQKSTDQHTIVSLATSATNLSSQASGSQSLDSVLFLENETQSHERQCSY